MSVLAWIVLAAVVIFVISFGLLLVGRLLPRRDDPDFAESATHAREGKDPGRD
jgi:hypothetical protein